ncbi:MAG: nucleotide sugar dehydrogenase, partial [Cyclobacteriaceae bacterium]
TKWNFLNFKPGLVGGHCIGVDPYYLTHKANSLGYHPEVILAGRKINDNMGVYIANRIIKLMTLKDVSIKNSRALVLGITFKENCPDIRNSRVVDIVQELESFGINVQIHDPHAEFSEVKHEYNLELIHVPEGTYDVVVIAVAHDEFKNINLSEFTHSNSVVFDVKGILPKEKVTARL